MEGAVIRTTNTFICASTKGTEITKNVAAQLVHKGLIQEYKPQIILIVGHALESVLVSSFRRSTLLLKNLQDYVIAIGSGYNALNLEVETYDIRKAEWSERGVYPFVKVS